MLSVDINDVIALIESCKPQLIGLAVAIVVGIILLVAVRKLPKQKKKFIRSQVGIAMGLAVVIVVNLICFGPASTLITLTMGHGTIDEETSVEAEVLGEKIAEEGIVLLENNQNVLPLTDQNKINVFGWASTNPVYGGTGSGAMNDAYHTVTLLEGLQDAGFSVNTELVDFYTDYRADRPVVSPFTQDWTLPEPPADTYSEELINNAKEFSDTAMIVIGRVGGEHADLPTDMAAVLDGSWSDGSLYTAGSYNNNSTEYADFTEGDHYLQLSQSEKDMVDLVCKNFDKVILVYNGANAFELGFTEDYSQISSVIWCPGAGQTGFEALGNIISGKVNPSGKTADTFVKDLKAAPTWNNFGSFDYTNMSEFDTTCNGHDESPSFVNYVEGIYSGYKFYETAGAEGAIDYDSVVMYPFGHGLSYTSFTQEMGEITEQEGQLSFDVTVTNTGDVAGKDVVEVYYNPPYTNGGIEKSTANLVAFDKTGDLAPGESETIHVSFAKEDMASYDTYGHGCYVLEQGDYVISVNSDAHTVLDEKIYTQNEDIVYSGENGRESDAVAAENRFAFAEGDVTYLSRADGFANYDEATAAPDSYEISAEHKAEFIMKYNYDPEQYNDDTDEMPVTGADNGISAVDLRGASYDDEKWNALLDELSIEDMSNLIALGGYQTIKIDSIDKAQTIDCDGPASINNNFTGVGSVGFPAAVMIASTWNAELANEFGQSIGKMADEMNVSGWYAPAMNIHRSAFSGRNFEYYSEDGVLSGKIAAQAVLGAKEYGVYAYVKHFALNDQEANRQAMLCTYVNEQAIREVYIKPFEIAIKEGGAQAVMSAYNYIGTKWAGACSELLNDVLRNEWGFRGMVLTDSFGAGGRGYMDADWAVRNGTDCMLINFDTGDNFVSDTTSATGVLAMRNACKNILYTTVNSRAFSEENLELSMETWKKAAIAIDIVLAGIFLALEVRICLKYRKKETIEVQ